MKILLTTATSGLVGLILPQLLGFLPCRQGAILIATGVVIITTSVGLLSYSHYSHWRIRSPRTALVARQVAGVCYVATVAAIAVVVTGLADLAPTKLARVTGYIVLFTALINLAFLLRRKDDGLQIH